MIIILPIKFSKLFCAGLAVETEIALSESHVSQTNQNSVVHPAPLSSNEPMPSVISDQPRRNTTRNKRDRQKTPADFNKNNVEISIPVPTTAATSSTSCGLKTTVEDCSSVVTSTILKNTTEPASLSVAQSSSKVLLTNSTTGHFFRIIFTILALVQCSIQREGGEDASVIM